MQIVEYHQCVMCRTPQIAVSNDTMVPYISQWYAAHIGDVVIGVGEESTNVHVWKCVWQLDLEIKQ